MTDMKSNRKIFILFITVISIALLMAHIQAYAYEPAIYNDGWKTLSKEELKLKMNSPVININTKKPFNFKMVNEQEEEVERVNTPLEYYNGVKKGNHLYSYTTYDIIDDGLFRGVAMPIIYYMKAKPSKYSYVRDFTFDKEDTMVILPVDFISWVGSDQREFIEEAKKQNKSWRDLSPSARIIKAEKDRIDLYDTFGEDFYKYKDEDRYEGGMASHVLSLEVLGDLNNDGYEDIVFSYAHYLVGGSGRSYRFVVLTRMSEEEVLRDITSEVGKIIWRDR